MNSVAVGLFQILLAIALFPSTFVRVQSAVPFQGCKGDGQVGPLPAPAIPDKTIRLDSNVAQRMTYYKAESGPGVLAPRGWNCVGSLGSAGSTLIVAPSIEKLTGPAIIVRSINGETSGRFDVAQVMARLFPSHRSFVQSVIDEGVLRASDFPSGPYPADRLLRRSDKIVEYETPARSEGLGTFTGLPQNGDPIRGVTILNEQPVGVFLLALRLPPNMNDLSTVIIQEVER